MVTIIEGLDGVGKTTICKGVCEKEPSLIYVKESYTGNNEEKEQRVKLMLERIMSDEHFLYDRTTLIDDFVYNFLNQSQSSLFKYYDIILVLLAHCQILHLSIDEEVRKQRFDQRGDEYVNDDSIKIVADAYDNFYQNLANVEHINLSGVLSKDVKKLVRRIKND